MSRQEQLKDRTRGLRTAPQPLKPPKGAPRAPIPRGRGCRGGSGAAGAQDGRCSQAASFPFPSTTPFLPARLSSCFSIADPQDMIFFALFSFLSPKRPTLVILWKAPPQTRQTKPNKPNPNGVIQAKQPQKKSLGAGGSGDRAVPTSTPEPCTAPTPKKHPDGTRGRNMCPVSSPGEDKAR